MGKIETAHERAKQAEPTIAEAHRAKSLEAHKRGAARRSKNTGVRTLDALRATFHDAEIQIRAIGRKQGREDFRALGLVMGRTLKYLLSSEPHTPAQLEKALSKIGAQAFGEAMRLEQDAVGQAAREAARAAGLPDAALYLPVTFEGLATLQRAVAERVASGMLPPAPSPTNGSNVVSFDVARRRTGRPGAP